MREDTEQPSSSSTAIATRPLGRTGMQITRVGLGAWAIGGPDWAAGWGAQDVEESVLTIRRAVDRGVNWIDTAAVYGLGHSEEIVGRALRAIPKEQRPYVFTKCGLVWDQRDRRASPARVGAARSIRRELEDSLSRLGVERIDLYQMHFPAADGTSLEEYWGALHDLKREGKVRAVGLSNHDAAQVETAERFGHVDVLQPRFSAIDRESARSLLPLCRAHEIGVIVYSPLQSGLLSGLFTIERAAALPTDDWRSRSADFSGRRLANNLAVADGLRSVAARLDTTVANVAVAWTLAWPGVTGAIVGARRPAQVEGTIGGATLALSPADMREIADVLRAAKAGRGPTLPEGLDAEAQRKSDGATAR